MTATQAPVAEKSIAWPRKHSVFGIRVSETDYDSALELVIQAGRQRKSAIVDHMSAHGLTEFSDNPDHTRMMNDFEVVAPDGQPVRWAVNFFHGTKMGDRVYGPELMRRICERAAREKVGIYLYGSSPDVLEKLEKRLRERFPGIDIAGSESPPFRALTPEEDAETVARINDSGAGIVFLGLGCPKQEIFAYEHRERIHAVQMCVGAAFDFLAETKPMAPAWMQKRGLEWAFRLASEPDRLWRRYLFANSKFLMKCGREMVSGRSRN